VGRFSFLPAWSVYEGIHRLLYPPAAGGTAILVVALVGIAVNLAATWQLSKANRESMNVEGSFKHILTDLIVFRDRDRDRRSGDHHHGFTRADGIDALFVQWTVTGVLGFVSHGSSGAFGGQLQLRVSLAGVGDGVLPSPASWAAGRGLRRGHHAHPRRRLELTRSVSGETVFLAA
jgi:hypothetical protein